MALSSYSRSVKERVANWMKKLFITSELFLFKGTPSGPMRIA